jgi:hypothetical protein
VIIGDFWIIRYFEGTASQMFWLTINDQIPEWCSVEMFLGYAVNYQFQHTVKILDCSVSLTFLGAATAEEQKLLDIDSSFATQMISHAGDDLHVCFHFRTEHFPMTYSPHLSTVLVYQENGVERKANHLIKLGPAKMNNYGILAGLSINQIKDVGPAKTVPL